MADILGAFEQAVLLSVVRLGDGAYGRTILSEVSACLERDVAAGAVYATLDRLEGKKLLTSRLGAGTEIRAGRARRFYKLSAKGHEALKAARAAVERIWSFAGRPLGARA